MDRVENVGNGAPMMSRIRGWFAAYRQRRAALRLAVRYFETTKHTFADSAGCYVYLRAGDSYFVKVSDLITSQWYCVKADGTSIDELHVPPPTNS
jgi:hypothetical protein